MHVQHNNDGSAATSVTYRAKDTAEVSDIQASEVVIAAGPWTTGLFPGTPIEDSRNHSIFNISY
jgi:glycerol-3-phosphate dehydrogenase